LCACERAGDNGICECVNGVKISPMLRGEGTVPGTCTAGEGGKDRRKKRGMDHLNMYLLDEMGKAHSRRTRARIALVYNLNRKLVGLSRQASPRAMLYAVVALHALYCGLVALYLRTLV